VTTPRPIKVLHIISGDLWAGAEVQAFTLLSAMKKSKEVEVAAVLMNEGELAKRLRQQGIPTTIFPENEMGAPTIFLALRRLLKQWQPDIVHTHRNKENILGAIANRFATRAKSVRTVHGATESSNTNFFHIHKRILAYLNHWTGRYLQEKIIAVSQELAQKLSAFFPHSKIVVIENGVDIELVRSQTHPVDFKINQPDATHVGIIGRLVPVKRVDLFLETAALLQKKAPQHHWQFHVIGSGPLEKTLADYAHQLDLSHCVTFHGHRHDIIACIAALDVVVMCSDHEGLPMTLLEALALGKPVVGHAVGGIHSTLSLIDPQLLVYKQTAREFAKRISHIADQPQLGFSLHSQQIFAQRFSNTSNLDQTLAVYRSTLQEVTQ
jgi:L-malate glycosyltransferase